MIIKVCACCHDGDRKRFMFQAPHNANISLGDRVLCETRYGDCKATVKGITNLSDEEPTYRILLAMTGATHPLKKIKGVYQYRALEENLPFN